MTLLDHAAFHDASDERNLHEAAHVGSLSHVRLPVPDTSREYAGAAVPIPM